MKVYLVVELRGPEVPRIVGCFRKKKDAEQAAYADRRFPVWRNVIELRVLGGTK